jgi:hypothetical protein
LVDVWRCDSPNLQALLETGASGVSGLFSIGCGAGSVMVRAARRGDVVGCAEPVSSR